MNLYQGTEFFSIKYFNFLKKLSPFNNLLYRIDLMFQLPNLSIFILFAITGVLIEDGFSLLVLLSTFEFSLLLMLKALFL